MKAKEIKTWQPADVRRVCINFDYYTCGDNEEYDTMLEFVRAHKPTTNNILWVANDICNHSDLHRYNATYTEKIESIMYNLYAGAVRVFFELS